MNQTELQTLADERIKDADALLLGGRWSFAYYAAGYAVECGLKSCLLARMIHTGWVFQEKVKIGDCLVHDFDELVPISGLTDELRENQKVDGDFAVYWSLANKWKVTDRYVPKSEADAKTLYAAITDKEHGVLAWIRKFW